MSKDISQARAKLFIREASRLPDIGDMREKITVERAVSTPDGGGGYTRSWAPLVANEFASVIPTGGREALLNEALSAIQGYKVTLRYQSGSKVRADDRIDWNGVKMNIRSAADPLGTKVFTVIFADAGAVTQ